MCSVQALASIETQCAQVVLNGPGMEVDCVRKRTTVAGLFVPAACRAGCTALSAMVFQL